MTVYYNKTGYFVDVSYVESSLAYNGSFDRRKQYMFTLKNETRDEWFEREKKQQSDKSSDKG